jgi:tetratricopeptide (TPR) repeat protein
MPSNSHFRDPNPAGTPPGDSLPKDEQSRSPKESKGQIQDDNPRRPEVEPLSSVDTLLDDLGGLLEAATASGESGSSMALYTFGDRLLAPDVIERARQRLEVVETSGENASQDRTIRVAQFLEHLQADPENTVLALQSVADFRATQDALTAFVQTSSPEEALRVLVEQQTLLLSDLAADLMQAKVEELRQAGAEEAAAALSAGPQRLLEDARRHGLERGPAMWGEREEALAKAQEALRLAFEHSPAEVVSGVNALMAARDSETLIHTIALHRDVLVQPSAAVLLRRVADVYRAHDAHSIAAHFESLADVGKHLDRHTTLAPEPAAWVAAIEGGLLEGEPEDPHARVASLRHVLSIVSKITSPRAWALLACQLGRAFALDVHSEGEAHLGSAIAAFDAALGLEHAGLDAGECAEILLWKGQAVVALSVLVAPKQQQTDLGEAIRCYDKALALAGTGPRGPDMPTRVPLAARILLEKGQALRDLANFASGASRALQLQQAIACCDAAHHIVGDSPPQLRAMVLRKKGLLLIELSDLLAPDLARRTLEDACRVYDEALDALPRDLDAREWAKNQSNKALALRARALLTTGDERADLFAQALQGFELAQDVIHREDGVDDWVTLQVDMGTTLGMVAERMGDTVDDARAARALTCLDAALAALSPDNAPQRWAVVQFSKANILGILSEHRPAEEALTNLREAASCYDSALRILHHDGAPAVWNAIQNSYGRSLLRLADVLEGDERMAALRGAVERFDAVLSGLGPNDAPLEWANLQVNKGDALSRLSSSWSEGSHEVDFEKAVACYDSALSVYTWEDVPDEHRRVARAACYLLLTRGERDRAAVYLASALESLEDT